MHALKPETTAEGSAHSDTCSRSLTSAHTFSTRTDAAKGMWSGNCWKLRDTQAAWSSQGPPEGGGAPATGGKREVGQPGKAPRWEEAQCGVEGPRPPGPAQLGVAPGEPESASDASE